MDREKLNKFYEFLDREVPQEGGCMLCKVVSKAKKVLTEEEYDKIDYFVIVRLTIANGFMFLINSRFWYDYKFLFDNEWEVIYKRHSA